MSKSFFARDKCRSVVGKVSVKEDGHSEGWRGKRKIGGEEKRGWGRGGMRETVFYHVSCFHL